MLIYRVNGCYWSSDKEVAYSDYREVDDSRIMLIEPMPRVSQDEEVVMAIGRCLNNGYDGFYVDNGFGNVAGIFLIEG